MEDEHINRLSSTSAILSIFKSIRSSRPLDEPLAYALEDAKTEWVAMGPTEKEKMACHVQRRWICNPRRKEWGTAHLKKSRYRIRAADVSESVASFPTLELPHNCGTHLRHNAKRIIAQSIANASSKLAQLDPLTSLMASSHAIREINRKRKKRRADLGHYSQIDEEEIVNIVDADAPVIQDLFSSNEATRKGRAHKKAHRVLVILEYLHTRKPKSYSDIGISEISSTLRLPLAVVGDCLRFVFGNDAVSLSNANFVKQLEAALSYYLYPYKKVLFESNSDK